MGSSRMATLLTTSIVELQRLYATTSVAALPKSLRPNNGAGAPGTGTICKASRVKLHA